MIINTNSFGHLKKYISCKINLMFSGAYNNQGNAYSSKGRYDKAIAVYNKAIEINPRLAKVYNNRGVAYFYKRKYDRVWDDVHKAQSIGYQDHIGFLKDLRKASGRQR